MPRFDIPGLPVPIIPSIGGSGGGDLPSLNRQPGESVGEALRRVGREIAARNAPPADPSAPGPTIEAPPDPYYPPPSDQPPPSIPDDTWGTPVPPGTFDEPLSTPVQNASWFGLGIGNWLFGSGKRGLKRRQKAMRSIDAALERWLRRSTRVVGSAAGDIMTAPRTYGVIARTAAGVGVGVGLGVDVLYPSELGVGTLDPRDRAREFEKAQQIFSEDLTKYTRVADRNYPDYVNRRIGVDPRQFPLGRDTNVPAGSAYIPFPQWPEVPKPVQDRGRAGIEKYMRDRAERALKRAVPEALRPYVPDLGPPAPGSTPSATTTQQIGGTGSGTRPAGRARTGASLPTGLPLYLGIALVSAVLPGLFRRSCGSMAGITNTLTPTIGSEPSPLPSPLPDPLTPTNPTVGGFPSIYTAGGGWGSDEYCRPKPRGPRRKCLERAPVKYSGGRRKGKAAGTKCLRWEARRK